MHPKNQCQITNAIFLAFMEAYGFYEYEDALSIQLFLVITAWSGLYWFYPVLKMNEKEKETWQLLNYPFFQIRKNIDPADREYQTAERFPIFCFLVN